MNDRLCERLKIVLDRILDGYDHLKEFESKGTTKEDLRQELINIRDTCEEIPALFGESAKELGLDIEKLTPLANLLKVNFDSAIKVQLMIITDPNTPNNEAWIKMQSNMAITMMNMNGQIDQIRMLRKIIK
ncbi:MAG: hypothetical protein HRU07_06860 [Nitrosopumilus sp.]|nr:hypothetical protein [Nitrosopumilus sp.]NRA05859.1 hypothetical protein [Nitrosopumilus sp.]